MPLEGLHLGPYRLLRLLGSGGMGEVYLAEDARIDQQVAIKVIRAEGLASPGSAVPKEAARLFEREAKAIARLDHPNILPLYAYGEERLNDTQLTYLVMPYRKEGTLATWLRQRGGSQLLSPAEVVPLLQQAADALQHAHDQQIIHQDVKPTNFLIRLRSDRSHRPDLLLADFGIAKLTSATASTSQSIRGTPIYMAPEQWDGHPAPATDQYALAIMVYELLVGHPPFRGGPGQVMRQHYMMSPPVPSTFNPRLSPAIDAVLLHALAKHPGERFPLVTTFARAFEEAVQSSRELHATLAISQTEAESGTTRTLTLPGGRQVNITIPPGIEEGTILRLEGQGSPYYEGGPAGLLILTISVQAAKQSFLLQQDSTEPTVPVSIFNAGLLVEESSVPSASIEASGNLEPMAPASNESKSATTAFVRNATSPPTTPGLPYTSPVYYATAHTTNATSLSAEMARSSTLSALQPQVLAPAKPVRRNISQRIVLLGLAGLLIMALGSGIAWLTLSHPSPKKITSTAPAEAITEFPVPTAGSSPNKIAVGPDGNFWFTEEGVNKIGRITSGK